jgi:DNA-binding NarL/FixJ family response regulator
MTIDEDLLFRQAVLVGALGFFNKDVTLERLADAIRKVASGKAALQPARTESVVQAV